MRFSFEPTSRLASPRRWSFQFSVDLSFDLGVGYKHIVEVYLARLCPVSYKVLGDGYPVWSFELLPEPQFGYVLMPCRVTWDVRGTGLVTQADRKLTRSREESYIRPP